MGHQVDFLLNESAGTPYFPTSAGIIRTTNFGRILRDGEFNARPRKYFGGLINLLSLNRALSKISRNYQVILANHSLTAVATTYAFSGEARKFYYIQAYEPEYYQAEKGFKARVAEWLSRKSYEADLYQIANAPNYIGYKNIKAKHWVPPGIDFNIFFPGPVSNNLASAKQITLGCIGRAEPSKGIRYVLEAFEILSKMDSRYRLSIAYGNLPGNWSHPLATVVIPENDVQLAEFYRGLDILIAPGTLQLGAHHYPVMEAMACGVPVVTTGYRPANEQNSWIVDVGSSMSIVEAVNDAVVSADIRQMKVNHAICDISTYSWDCVAKSFEEYFLAN